MTTRHIYHIAFLLITNKTQILLFLWYSASHVWCHTLTTFHFQSRRWQQLIEFLAIIIINLVLLNGNADFQAFWSKFLIIIISLLFCYSIISRRQSCHKLWHLWHAHSVEWLYFLLNLPLSLWFLLYVRIFLAINILIWKIEKIPNKISNKLTQVCTYCVSCMPQLWNRRWQKRWRHRD